MMHTTSGRRGGNGAIDIRLRGFGRFRKSSGTNKASIHKRRIALIRLLAEEMGEYDLVKALLDDKVSWGELERAQRHQRLRDPNLLASVRLDRSLESALLEVLAWLEERRRPRATVAWFKTHSGYLVPLGVLHKDALVRDLAGVDWPLVMERWEAAAATKNGLRRAMSRFLSIYLKDKYHPFRRALINPDAWPVIDEPKPIREMDAALFWSLMERVPPRLIDCYVLLAVTGMRVGEYLNDADLVVDRLGGALLVKGKRGHKRYAVAPSARYLIASAVPCRAAPLRRPPVSIQSDPRYKALLKPLQKAGRALGHDDVRLHDLRRLFVRAGVREMGETATQYAVGHETADVTRAYAREDRADEVAHAVASYLGLDARAPRPSLGVA